MTLVCPYCGEDEFTESRTTRTTYTVQVDDNGSPIELSEEVSDGGDFEDVYRCVNCAADLDPDELVTTWIWGLNEAHDDGDHDEKPEPECPACDD